MSAANVRRVSMAIPPERFGSMLARMGGRRMTIWRTARNQGGGQYRELWGNDYRQTANDNMLVVIMIETPEGVANAEKIAAVPGIDVIFAASTDLGNFSGHKQGEPQY